MAETQHSSTVFITGTSSGIGLATAILFHSKGWNVVAALRSPEKAPEELRSLDSSRLLITKCDVTNLDSIHAAVSATLEKFGKVNCVVNNAGYGLMGVFEGLPREKVLEEINTNYIGLMDVTRAFLPHLRQTAKSSGKGQVGVINIVSGAGNVSFPSGSIYCATKLAVENFTESLFYELSNYNVFAKLVMPCGGFVEGTSFNHRVMKEMMECQNGEIDEAYAAYREKVMEVFTRFGKPACSAAEVAQKIHEAATDHTIKLRYFLGKDDSGIFKLKYGGDSEEADEKYIAALRKLYGF